MLATPKVAGIYNIVYRYLFDRRRDLALPTSFLVDANGMIVKVYQGLVNPERIAEDLKTAPKTTAARMRKALPFEGTLYQEEFQRNDFTYGVAMFQRGYSNKPRHLSSKSSRPSHRSRKLITIWERCTYGKTLYRMRGGTSSRREASPRLSGSMEQSWNGRCSARPSGRGHSQLPAVLSQAGLCHCAAEPRKFLSATGSS